MLFTCEARNTIRIQCTFTDSSDSLTDVDDIELTIYDHTKTLIDTIETVTRVSEGVYYALYTTPESTSDKTYYCTMAGTVDGYPVSETDKFKTKFYIK